MPTFSQVSWADDLAAFVCDADANSLPGKAHVAYSAICTVLEEHSLAINYVPSKTEVILAFHGKEPGS